MGYSVFFIFTFFKKKIYRNIFLVLDFTVLYPYRPATGACRGPWREPAAPLPGGRGIELLNLKPKIYFCKFFFEKYKNKKGAARWLRARLHPVNRRPAASGRCGHAGGSPTRRRERAEADGPMWDMQQHQAKRARWRWSRTRVRPTRQPASESTFQILFLY